MENHPKSRLCVKNEETKCDIEYIPNLNKSSFLMKFWQRCLNRLLPFTFWKTLYIVRVLIYKCRKQSVPDIKIELCGGDYKNNIENKETGIYIYVKRLMVKAV